MKNVKCRMKGIVRKINMIVLMGWIALSCTQYVFAEDINNSMIVRGTEKLIGDVTTWLMVIAPVVAGLLIIYFCVRRSAADEMDTKKWNDRITVAIVSCIGAILGSATLNLLLGYYK